MILFLYQQAEYVNREVNRKGKVSARKTLYNQIRIERNEER